MSLGKEELMSVFGLEPVVASLLERRGFASAEEARAFLYADDRPLTPPEAYDGLLPIAARIRAAVAAGERILIYGDYDCDGICAASILKLSIEKIGGQADVFLPDRRRHGYGLTRGALEEIAERFYPDLIVTVDCGIGSVREVTFAQETLGVDVCVTDHHEPGECLPDCPVCNPKLSERGFRDLCGAGVALRLAEALGGRAACEDFFDLAALATVADVVPLSGDNRVIVRKGLKAINAGRRTGIRKLTASCMKDVVRAQDIAFRLAPRINSVGRLGDANPLIEFFCGEDDFVADCLLKEIERANAARTEATERVYAQAADLLVGADFTREPIAVVYKEDWEEGVLGIAAARLAGDLNHPVILLTRSGGMIKGSGRSVEGFDLLEAVLAGAAFCGRAGGHKMACGVSFFTAFAAEDEDEEAAADMDRDADVAALTEKVEGFRNCINEFARVKYDEAFFMPRRADAIALDGADPLAVAKQLTLLEPFGEGNPEPLFSLAATGDGWSTFKDGAHLRYRRGSLDLVNFFAGDRVDKCRARRCVARFRLNYAVYRNIESAKGIVESLDFGAKDDFSAYLETGSAAHDSIFRPTPIDDPAAFLREPCGTCFIAYGETAYARFRDAAAAQGLPLKTSLNAPLSPLNTLLHAPDAAADLRFFKRLVLLEEPIFTGFIDELRLNADCRVYIARNTGMLERTAGLLPDYAALGEIFKKIRALLREGRREAPAALCARAAGRSDCDDFLLALAVFRDLGLVKFSENAIMLEEGVKNKLENSRIYHRLSEAAWKAIS